MSEQTDTGPKPVWTSVRLELETATALASYATRLRDAVAANPGAYPPFLTSRHQVSMGQALRFLLWQQANRSARGRDCQRRHRKASAATMAAVREAIAATDAGAEGECQGTPDAPDAPHVG